LRLFLKLMLLGALVAPSQGQDRHDWQSLARLQSGDRVRMSLKTGPVDGEFQSWTPQELTVGTVTAKREVVIKIERYRHGGSRAKHAAFGAMIGFAGGFAGGASHPLFNTPAQQGALVGGVGAGIGAIIGALLPTHSKELIYSAR
jgi:hypothetical protein